MNIISFFKKIKIYFGQGNLRTKTKGKIIALELARNGLGKKVLDVGCREGFQSKWFEKNGYIVTSVDIEKRYEKSIIVDVNERLPFKDNYFNLIWCSEVIEHLDNPQKSISEFRRVTKKNGDLIITTPNSYFWLMRFLNVFGLTPRKLQRSDHKHFFSLKDIKKIFPKSEILGFFPYFGIKFTIKKLVGFLSPTFIIYERNNN